MPTKEMRTSLLRIVFAFAAIIVLAASQINLTLLRGRAQPALTSSESDPQPSQNRSALPAPLLKPHIVVKKNRRELLLYSSDNLLRTYHVGLGLNPSGDKVRAGDRRTPEGDFYVFVKNDKSAFYLSLGLSYPNLPHAERGLREGLINRSQYEAIIRALKARKTPPQNTRLGGDIYIHGNGAQSDWTWGCVALEDEDIRELFAAVTVGTPVTIQP
jgi:murein L,D-transpeptidase YafK